MKRIGFLWEKVCDRDNFYSAYGKACLGKKERAQVRSFSDDLSKNIESLLRDCEDEKFCFGRYHFFTIHEPKERRIAAAPFAERLVHHALMNICDPWFERQSASCSYACRRGMGMHKAVAKAQEYSLSYSAYLKLDIRKYFDSISHEILQEKLRRLFKDPKLLRCFDEIIGSYEKEEGKGLPIGNLTSQYFANYYLTFLDRFIKEKLKCRAYIRYMDDFLLFSHSKDELKDWHRQIGVFLQQELDLKIKDNVRLNITSRGIPFLGFVVRPGGLALNRRSRKRFLRKFRLYQQQFENGKMAMQDYSARLCSLMAFTADADDSFLRAVLQKYEGEF